METQYKVNLVKELPHQERTRNRSPRMGGFGLAEDDLIYQMVMTNLEEEDRPAQRTRALRTRRRE